MLYLFSNGSDENDVDQTSKSIRPKFDATLALYWFSFATTTINKRLIPVTEKNDNIF